MECQACGSENREGRRFCSECGVSLASPCPQCAFVNDPGEKFCGGCGVSLAPASAPGASKPGAAQTPTPETHRQPKLWELSFHIPTIQR